MFFCDNGRLLCANDWQSEITIAFYYDCQNAAPSAPTAFQLRWEAWATNNGGGYNTTNLSSTGPPTNVTPVCQNITDPCNAGLAYAYEKYTYTGIITFPNRWYPLE